MTTLRYSIFALLLIGLFISRESQAQQRSRSNLDISGEIIIVFGKRDAPPPARDYPVDRYEVREHYPEARYARRKVHIPRGHYPPPGSCRVWYYDLPPGKQPPPEPCYRLRGFYHPDAIVITSNGTQWNEHRDKKRRDWGRRP